MRAKVLVGKAGCSGVYAGVAELADALASGASDRKVMWVQVPSPAPYVKAPRMAVMAVCGVFAFSGNIEMSFACPS